MSDREQSQKTTNRVYEVVKVPKASEYWDGGDEFSKRGIYPSGETMGGVYRLRENAEEVAEKLRESGPSERFGDTMDDAPYRIMVEPLEVIDAE